MRCPYLWSYVDGPTGRRFMGCVQKVFRGELEVAGFEAAERNGGFGGIKMTGDPLPQCQFRVEPAFEGDGPAHTCLNPSFFDINDPAEFDLRTGLPLASSMSNPMTSRTRAIGGRLPSAVWERRSL